MQSIRAFPKAGRRRQIDKFGSGWIFVVPLLGDGSIKADVETEFVYDLFSSRGKLKQFDFVLSYLSVEIAAHELHNHYPQTRMPKNDMFGTFYAHQLEGR